MVRANSGYPSVNGDLWGTISPDDATIDVGDSSRFILFVWLVVS